MKFRGLIVAVLVLLALGGVLYWSNHRKPAEQSAATPATTSVSILKLNQGTINDLTLARTGSEPVSLAKESSGTWQITKPKAMSADQDQIDSLLSTLSILNADRLLEDKATDLAQYGLSNPQASVDIQTTDHQHKKLLLGDSTPAGDDVYAMLDGDSRVFTIPSYEKTNIDKGLNDLRDKHLLTVGPDKVSHVTLQNKGQSIEFARIKGGWQIMKPQPLRADNFAVDEMVRAVADARMDLSEAKDDPATEFARGTPLASVTLTGDRGTQTLEVRKDNGNDYARSSAVPGIYKVDAIIDSTLNQSLNDFRNKKLFDFGFENPDKIALQDGSKSWFFSRTGSDWWLDGKKMNSTSLESLIDKLRNLSAASFPSTGFSSPIIQITVTTGGGKQVEKVLISKSGSQYIAKREREPALYQLNASDVNDITSAPATIQLAAGSKH